MEEIWKTITKLARYNSRYEIVKWVTLNGTYKVSNRGRLVRKDGFFPKLSPYPNGYVVVSIEGKRFKLQQVVMQTFYPEGIKSGYTVDHIDRNPLNNDISNLRWADVALQVQNRENKEYKYKRVLCRENGIIYSSCQEAEERLGLVKNTVSRVARGERKSIHGYHFDYVGCELDKEYFDKGCERFKQETSQLSLFK